MPPKGLSLVETLVVIAIVVLFTVVALPYFHSAQQHSAVRGDAQSLLSDLREAQQSTIGEQVSYLIKLFTTTPQQYELIRRQNSIDTIIKQRPLSQGVTWQNTGGFTNNEILFTTSGAAVQSGAITLTDNSNYTVTVTVEPAGYVKLH